MIFTPKAPITAAVATETRWVGDTTVAGIQLERGVQGPARLSELSEKITRAVQAMSYAVAAGAGIAVAAAYGGEMESWRAAASGAVISATGWALTRSLYAHETRQGTGWDRERPRPDAAAPACPSTQGS